MQDELGSDAKQAPVADGLPEEIKGAEEEYQQRFFLKLLLESVLENQSNVLDYSALLKKYASLSGQNHKGYAAVNFMPTHSKTHLKAIALLCSVLQQYLQLNIGCPDCAGRSRICDAS